MVETTSQTGKSMNFEPYVFDTKNVNAQSLVHLINLTQPSKCIGVELGVGYGQSILTLLQQCPNIKQIYGIDTFSPYYDYHKDDYDDTPVNYLDEKQSHLCGLMAKHNIKFSGVEKKVVLIESPAEEIVDTFEDQSIDFIFMDCYSKPDEYYNAMVKWYPKIKTGGLFSGHDYQYNYIKKLVSEFRNNFLITKTMSTHDNLWVWMK